MTFLKEVIESKPICQQPRAAVTCLRKYHSGGIICQETNEHCIRHGNAYEFFVLGIRPVGGSNRQLIVYHAVYDCRLQRFACAKQAVNRHQSLDAREPMPTICLCKVSSQSSPRRRCICRAHANAGLNQAVPVVHLASLGCTQ